MLTEDQWMIEYEQVGEDIDAGLCDDEEAVARLKALGLSAEEISEHLEGRQA